MIRLDSTQISTVVLCDKCPWWQELADSRDEGWRIAAGHEQRNHPGTNGAREALRKRVTRG